ncbi:MAG: lytic murein transglycosylase [Alphaproteobacteria bacterium MedPE-SWcel]|nr:MAG: lytic murein transglycosylase [Alphaproteobacteria bacterium MedPE-SWcel]
MKRAVAAILGVMVAGTGMAQDDAGSAVFPQFDAKRIRPPGPGTQRRITVQIDPVSPGPTDPTVPVTAPDGSLVPSPSEARFDWFWDAVGGDLAGASPGRLAEGLAVLERRAEVPVPRLQDLQDMIGAHGVALLISTIGTEVSPALALAVMAVESGGQANAVSGAGAKGLMQLMPATAERFGVVDAFDPQQNILGGVRFLDWLMTEFSGDPMLVLAGYNAGARAVREHAGVPPFAETRDYVPKVLAAYGIARNLCATPPIMISDGCVFQVMK